MQSEEERGGGSDHAYDKTGEGKKKSREDEEGLGWRQEKYLKATAYQEIAVKQYAAQDTLPRCENTHAQCIAYKQV